MREADRREEGTRHGPVKCDQANILSCTRKIFHLYFFSPLCFFHAPRFVHILIRCAAFAAQLLLAVVVEKSILTKLSQMI